MQTSAASQIVGIHTVGIRVTNQVRALSFYVDVLGRRCVSIDHWATVPVGLKLHPLREA